MRSSRLLQIEWEVTRDSPECVCEGLAAFTWYRDYVLLGAIQHKLPQDYVDRCVRAAPTIPDPLPERAAPHQTALAAARRSLNIQSEID